MVIHLAHHIPYLNFTNKKYLQNLNWCFSKISVSSWAQISLPYKRMGFTSVSNR